jgi:ABC-type transporter Mla MlaB component
MEPLLRISIDTDAKNNVRLSVEGWLVGLWVNELRRQSEQALSESKTVTLDLEKLWFADSAGVALLRELAERQVTHLNCSIFIRHRLEEAAL